jgi:hypothetical protein
MNIEEIREDEQQLQENHQDRSEWVKEDTYEFKVYSFKLIWL